MWGEKPYQIAALREIFLIADNLLENLQNVLFLLIIHYNHFLCCVERECDENSIVGLVEQPLSCIYETQTYAQKAMHTMSSMWLNESELNS